MGRENKKISKGGKYVMLNTHDKLLSAILKGKISAMNLYTYLSTHGYKGTIRDMARLLLFAMADTKAFIDSSCFPSNPRLHLTTDEYFTMLSTEMNKYQEEAV